MYAYLLVYCLFLYLWTDPQVSSLGFSLKKSGTIMVSFLLDQSFQVRLPGDRVDTDCLYKKLSEFLNQSDCIDSIPA